MMMKKSGREDTDDWEFPPTDLYEEVMVSTCARFLEIDLTYQHHIPWSSVGQSTGIGAFSMTSTRMDLVTMYRGMLSEFEHPEYKFETFPKNCLIDSYGLTMYVHKGTLPFRPPMLIDSFRLSNPALKGTLELVDVKVYPLDHPSPKRQGVRIFVLQPDQTFLDSIYEYPTNYPFKINILRNIYIRGGARRNTKDPRAQRPPGRLRVGKKALKKFLD